jgi:hypothetical protein
VLLMLGLLGGDVVAMRRAGVVQSSRNDMIQPPRFGDIEKGEIEAPRVAGLKSPHSEVGPRSLPR